MSGSQQRLCQWELLFSQTKAEFWGHQICCLGPCVSWAKSRESRGEHKWNVLRWGWGFIRKPATSRWWQNRRVRGATAVAGPLCCCGASPWPVTPAFLPPTPAKGEQTQREPGAWGQKGERVDPFQIYTPVDLALDSLFLPCQ